MPLNLNRQVIEYQTNVDKDLPKNLREKMAQRKKGSHFFGTCDNIKYLTSTPGYIAAKQFLDETLKKFGDKDGRQVSFDDNDPSWRLSITDMICYIHQHFEISEKSTPCKNIAKQFQLEHITKSLAAGFVFAFGIKTLEKHEVIILGRSIYHIRNIVFKTRKNQSAQTEAEEYDTDASSIDDNVVCNSVASVIASNSADNSGFYYDDIFSLHVIIFS